MIEVKVRNIDKAGEVLSAAVDAGANVNNGIEFTLSSSEDYYNQALAKAVADQRHYIAILQRPGVRHVKRV